MAGAAACICASAASEYGTLTALGCDLYVSVLPRSVGGLGVTAGAAAAAAGGAGTGRASVTGGTETSGAVVSPAPSAAGSSGGRTRSNWPTRITFTFSRLFIAASSR
ncbi:MAG: hypothetical protein IPM02_27280 [Betaproteobacteria bacterium]|nr:hypothetical protein [Betaproteobacteria bacterium]